MRLQLRAQFQSDCPITSSITLPIAWAASATVRLMLAGVRFRTRRDLQVLPLLPLYVLRVPVRYYRQPPVYFGGWRTDAPPRWGDHWGREWEQGHSGWDRWNRNSAPALAPVTTAYGAPTQTFQFSL